MPSSRSLRLPSLHPAPRPKTSRPRPTKTELPKPDADGFITIFNGKDLTGWEGLEDYWSVKDGVISGHETKDKSKQTFLVCTGGKVSDFELHIKYKFATPDGNSGIQFRSKVLDPKTFRVGGYQADFDAKAGYDGSIYDEAGVAGGRGTMSNRGEKTTWDADNKRQNEKLAESGADLKKAHQGRRLERRRPRRPRATTSPTASTAIS